MVAPKDPGTRIGKLISTVDGCEILHHRKNGWNPINNGKKTLPVNWCRISQPSPLVAIWRFPEKSGYPHIIQRWIEQNHPATGGTLIIPCPHQSKVLHVPDSAANMVSSSVGTTYCARWRGCHFAPELDISEREVFRPPGNIATPWKRKNTYSLYHIIPFISSIPIIPCNLMFVGAHYSKFG